MKHTIKQLLSLLLALCLVFSLAACGSDPAGSTENTEPLPTDSEPGTTAVKDTRPTDGIDDPVIPDLPAEWGAEGDINFYSYSGKMSVDGAYGVAGEGAATPAVPGSREPAGEPMIPGDPREPGDVPPDPGLPAEPLKLTAAEWKDNDNWPFFTNLVNNGTIAFPSFGLDPRNRIEVRVTSPAAALANETVTLLDAEGAVLWTARTDKNGVAYVFWAEGQTPAKVVCGEASAEVLVPEASGDPQGNSAIKPLDTVTLTVEPAAPAQTGMQIMFIVDTTGSMGDEIAYLQKDFSAIAERVGNTGVTWSVNFYRDEGDEYVTRTNGFTSDIADVQAKINAEYADGGGDTPEAVAEILTACLTSRTDWDENSVKLAFLIFDAPPHDGKDAALRAAVNAAAEKGVHLIPVVASNADRETELFGRALAILTGGTYVFLTDDSGIGDSHLEPIVGSYTVELLQDLIVRIIDENRP